MKLIKIINQDGETAGGFFIGYNKWNVVKDFFRGIKYGFPLCCIINYCLLILCEIPPALGMNKIFGNDGGVDYVRCVKCRKLNYFE